MRSHVVCLIVSVRHFKTWRKACNTWWSSGLGATFRTGLQRTAQTASEVAETVTWLGSAIARPLKCARTHAHNDAECASGWLLWYGCGAGAAFHDLRSGLHRRFLEQISNRPNRHCGDIPDGCRCLKKKAKAFRTHTTCYGLHCCESSSPAWRARPWCVHQAS